jgi:hypothetical protein
LAQTSRVCSERADPSRPTAAGVRFLYKDWARDDHHQLIVGVGLCADNFG